MNAYRLQKPDGRPTGIWVCGKCHQHQGQVDWLDEINEVLQKNAELCCTPEWDIEMNRRMQNLTVVNLADGSKHTAEEWLTREREEEQD